MADEKKTQQLVLLKQLRCARARRCQTDSPEWEMKAGARLYSLLLLHATINQSTGQDRVFGNSVWVTFKLQLLPTSSLMGTGQGAERADAAERLVVPSMAYSQGVARLNHDEIPADDRSNY